MEAEKRGSGRERHEYVLAMTYCCFLTFGSSAGETIEPWCVGARFLLASRRGFHGGADGNLTSALINHQEMWRRRTEPAHVQKDVSVGGGEEVKSRDDKWLKGGEEERVTP